MSQSKASAQGRLPFSVPAWFPHLPILSRLGTTLVVGLWTLSCTMSPPGLTDRPDALIVTQGSRVAHWPEQLALAIQPFENRTGDPVWQWMTTGIPDVLTSQLTGQPNLLIVPRRHLRELEQEQRLQASGRMADGSTTRIGQWVGANLLLVGSLSRAGARLRIDGQWIGIEQGTVMGTASAEGPIEQGNAVVTAFLQKAVGVVAGPRNSPGAPFQAAPMLESAEALEEGKQKERAGDLWGALSAYERGEQSVTPILELQPRYANLLRQLTILAPTTFSPRQDSSRTLWQRQADRTLQTLLQGTGRITPATPETVGSQLLLDIHVNPAAVEELITVVTLHGGTVRRAPDQHQIQFDWSETSPEIDAFLERLQRPHRIYLRAWMTETNRGLVYSRGRLWRMDHWIFRTGPTSVTMYPTRTWQGYIPITPFLVSYLNGTGRIDMMVTPVEEETQHVSIDPLERWEGYQDKHQVGRSVPSVEPLQSTLAAAWDPIITEPLGFWGGGNRNNWALTAIFPLGEPGPSSMGNGPRLIHGSGNPDLDQTTLTWLQQEVSHWWKTQPQPPVPGDILKLRITLQLRMALPPVMQLPLDDPLPQTTNLLRMAPLVPTITP